MRLYYVKLNKLFQLEQGNEELMDSFRRRLRSRMTTLKMVGGEKVFLPNLHHLDDKKPAEEDKKSDEETIEEVAAMFFLY